EVEHGDRAERGGEKDAGGIGHAELHRPVRAAVHGVRPAVPTIDPGGPAGSPPRPKRRPPRPLPVPGAGRPRVPHPRGLRGDRAGREAEPPCPERTAAPTSGTAGPSRPAASSASAPHAASPRDAVPARRWSRRPPPSG